MFRIANHMTEGQDLNVLVQKTNVSLFSSSITAASVVPRPTTNLKSQGGNRPVIQQ